MIQAGVKSDRDTIAKLKILAGGQSVSKFLRDLAAGSPPPSSHIEDRLDEIQRSLVAVERHLALIEEAFFRSPALRKHMKAVLDEEDKKKPIPIPEELNPTPEELEELEKDHEG